MLLILRVMIMYVLVTIFIFTTLGNSIFGNPYVKDLYKACAKDRQECVLECTGLSDLTGPIVPEELACVKTCNVESNTCQLRVQRLNELNRQQPSKTHFEAIPANNALIEKVKQSRLRSGVRVVEDDNL